MNLSRFWCSVTSSETFEWWPTTAAWKAKYRARRVDTSLVEAEEVALAGERAELSPRDGLAREPEEDP